MKTDPKLSKARIVVESLDGETYAGAKFNDVVGQMRERAWGGEASDGIKGYMKQVAKRIWDWSHKSIRIGSAEHFLRDMEKEGLLKMRVRGSK